jgi:uncharacterized membrane protein YkoI
MRTLIGRWCASAVMGLLLLVLAVRADEEKVALDKVPKPVLDAVKAKFPKAELKGAAKEIKDGKTLYEISLQYQDTNYSVVFTPEGKITLIEKVIAAKTLPKAVTRALEAKYPKATIKLAEELSDGNKVTAYEVVLVTADKKEVKVELDPTGKDLKEEGKGKEEDGFTKDFSLEKIELSGVGQLSSVGRNPYFILEPGYYLVLEKGDIQLTITVLDETKKVDGVECRVVVENETKGGKEVEKSKNYFAISKRTNSVFYFGEDVGGAWLSGEKGAKFGLMMPGTPLLKARYYQEVAPGVAMDRAEIVSVTDTVVTPAGTFQNCLKTEETTPLEPKEKEYKYYAPGIGLVQEGELKLVKYGFVKTPKQ